MSSLHDRDIREPLFAFLEQTYGKVRILEEKMMGRSRADVIMVMPGALAGIEIKSDADTYTRLARQVKDYDAYFDYNLVVVGTSHAQHIEEHVPEHWGIITVEMPHSAEGTDSPAASARRSGSSKPSGSVSETSDTRLGASSLNLADAAGLSVPLAEAAVQSPDFYVLRKARKNPKDVLRAKLSFLWRPELNKLLEANWLPAYKSKSKDFVRRALLTEVTEDDLHAQISETLFERDYTAIAAQINAFRAEHGKKPRRKRKRPRRRKSLL